jgi:glycosyltransferase involved in cell wall biosynthesis
MFSIIIPVYNDKKIAQCLQSIQANDFKDFEIIVVDNNSSDPEIKEIVQRYPVKYLLETKTGSYAARNTGAKNAQGDILIFIDSDCQASQDWLQNIAASFKNNIDGLMGKITGINSNKIATLEQKFYEAVTANFLQKKNLSRIDTRNFAIKKEIFNKLKGFNEDLKYGGDMELGARLHENNYKIIYQDSVIIQHVNETNLNKIIRKRIEQNFDNYKIIDYHEPEFIAEYFPHLLKIKTLKKYYYLFIICLPIFKVLTKLTKCYVFYKYSNIAACKIGSLKCYLQKT